MPTTKNRRRTLTAKLSIPFTPLYTFSFFFRLEVILGLTNKTISCVLSEVCVSITGWMNVSTSACICACKCAPIHASGAMALVMFLPFCSQDLISYSPHCLPYNSHHASLENLVLDRLTLIDIFLYISYYLSASNCIDIARRNSILVTHGTVEG